MDQAQPISFKRRGEPMKDNPLDNVDQGRLANPWEVYKEPQEVALKLDNCHLHIN